MGDYPNQQLLASVDWLSQHLDDPALRVLDARANDPRRPAGYRLAHIPGAIEIDPTRDFFVFTGRAPELAPPESIAQVLGQLGVGNDSIIVVYDDGTCQFAALTFWVLRLMGHQNVHILHGGWAQWERERRPVTGDVPHWPPAVYQAHVDDQARATAGWIQANITREDVLLLDVRSPDEFATRHIPGAVNLPYDGALDLRSQMFRDPGELRRRLESVGATPDKEIVAYGSAGARSSHLFATLHLLGYPRVRNYDGSLSDWYYQRGLPVE